jgi:hypothetical protein
LYGYLEPTKNCKKKLLGECLSQQIKNGLRTNLTDEILNSSTNPTEFPSFSPLVLSVEHTVRVYFPSVGNDSTASSFEN